MDTSAIEPSQNTSKQLLAAEVRELGEELFDLALQGRGDQPQNTEAESAPSENQQGEHQTLDELRAAANEFFTVLRLLLTVEP